MRFSIEGYRRLLTHPRYGGWIMIATLVYLISPIDLSPDIFPVVGQIDDLALVALVVLAASQWLTRLFVADPLAESQEPASSDSESVQQTIDVNAVEVKSSDA